MSEIFNIFKSQKTKYFKRQSDVFLYLKENRIIKTGQVVLLPSFICSEVIETLSVLNLRLVFYQLDSNLNLDFINIKQIMGKQKIDLFYLCRTFYCNKNITKIINLVENNNMSFLIDNAHYINIYGKIPNIESLNSNKFLIETFSPRKYFRLSEGAMLKINNEFVYTNSGENNIQFFKDKIKRSVLIRTLINKYIFIKLFKLIKKIIFTNISKKKKNIFIRAGVSNIYHYYYKKYEKYTENSHKSNQYYIKYLNLFKSKLSYLEEGYFENQVFWLIPLKKDDKVNNLVEILRESTLNPFMKWPDEHVFLSVIDKMIRQDFVFFRIDSLSCNEYVYNFISNIYNQ